jgi:protein involved in polysaccharide export with SLBB domain
MSLGARRGVGALLFLVPLWSASAQRAAPALRDPVLRPGDALRVNVWRHPEMSGEFIVAPDSTLVHPLYQVVKVAGAPLPVVKERLRGLLAAYEQDV